MSKIKSYVIFKIVDHANGETIIVTMFDFTLERECLITSSKTIQVTKESIIVSISPIIQTQIVRVIVFKNLNNLLQF
jgi:hypothetical protein